jgi:hypothetical protein
VPGLPVYCLISSAVGTSPLHLTSSALHTHAHLTPQHCFCAIWDSINYEGEVPRFVENWVARLSFWTTAPNPEEPLNDCCTHIIQIERLKLKIFKGNLNKFIEQNPEARAYFKSKSITTIKFILFGLDLDP